MADRTAGAGGRQAGAWDRVEAAEDRAASARDRQFANSPMEEGLRELATTVDVGFALRQIDPPEFLYLNPAYFKIFGLDPSGPTPLPTDAMSMIHPEDRARIDSNLAGITADRRIEQEWRVIRPDGTQRWISGRVSAVTDDNGVVRRLATIFEDVTSRKAADTALRESEERFDQLSRSTEVGFFLRESTRMLYLNPSMYRIFGTDPESPNPTVHDFMAAMHPDDRDAAAAVKAAADRGVSCGLEFRIIHPDGEVRWVRSTNNPVSVTDGGLPRVAGTITDITDRKNAEGTALQAQDQAQRANDAMDEFLSRMSHELRTPLNSVLGFAQLLELDTLSESQAEAVRYILRGGNHLLAMIDDVLDITGIESDRQALSLEPVRIAELVRDTIDLVQPVAATNRIEIHFDPAHPDAACHVRADRRRLKQVLLHLLSNAIKYNYPGGRVDVAVGADETRLSIAVTDTGMGIAAENLPRLFTPFDRLGRQTTDIEGTGLGLALSQRLTTLIGGRLDVRSTPGQGSTFTVTMPLTDPPPTPLPLVVDAGRGGPVALELRSTVLYIEDNPSNVDLLAGILRRRPGWTMSHAGNGVSGLDLAATTEPTVILLDLHLPDMNGIDVLRALKANQETSGVPVAILSADATATQVHRLLAAGANTYLTKPIDVREVIAFLDSHAR